MKSISTYAAYLKQNGKPLSETNPGSHEIALTGRNALFALDILKTDHEIILGGDILSEEDNQLVYAYQLWGQEYHDLSWYFTSNENESKEINAKRSNDLAVESVINACKVAETLRKECYIVLIIDS